MANGASVLDGLHTPDRRYIVVRGRLWRAANPDLPAAERADLTKQLMAGRRAVAAAVRSGDADAERRARRRVDQAKRSLGERGPVWWADGSPDFNRRILRNTPYREWYDRAELLGDTLQRLLDQGSASVCPSEVARAAAPGNWRSVLEAVREIARHLARRDEIIITQRGRRLDPDESIRGPIRLSRGSGEAKETD